MIRVVNEIHSSTTTKNKEWQEKLPVVVLKAEEIMYSKANSEVVLFLFSDLVTLPSDCLENVGKGKKINLALLLLFLVKNERSPLKES